MDDLPNEMGATHEVFDRFHSCAPPAARLLFEGPNRVPGARAVHVLNVVPDLTHDSRIFEAKGQLTPQQKLERKYGHRQQIAHADAMGSTRVDRRPCRDPAGNVGTLTWTPIAGFFSNAPEAKEGRVGGVRTPASCPGTKEYNEELIAGRARIEVDGEKLGGILASESEWTAGEATYVVRAVGAYASSPAVMKPCANEVCLDGVPSGV
jgi:hypothetical protein